MFGKKEINKSRAWKRLEHHYKSMRKVEMRDMFRKDPQRAERYSINLEGLMLDYSKNRINDRTIKYLLALAKERKLDEKSKRCFAANELTLPNIARFCTLPCVTAAIHRFMSTART